jgi:hypothetical protein
VKRPFILLVVPLLALTACGGNPPDHGIASADGGKASATTRASAGSSLSPDEARLRYARCMRDNGVATYPDDPKNMPKGGIHLSDKAVNACKKWQQAAAWKVIDGNDPETRDRFLKLARCMRAHGIDWPDPRPGGDLGGPPPDLSGVKDKAKVKTALKDCQRSWPQTPGK